MSRASTRAEAFAPHMQRADPIQISRSRQRVRSGIPVVQRPGMLAALLRTERLQIYIIIISNINIAITRFFDE